MDRKRLVYILKAASCFFEGNFRNDNTFSEKERAEACKELSSMRVGDINSTLLVDDEVSETLARHLNQEVSGEIAPLTLKEVKDILLSNACVSWVEKYCDGLSSTAIAGLAKIMTAEELGRVSRKIFNPIIDEKGRVIGAKNQFDSRIQPNSPGDDEAEILFSILESLSYGCGGVMIGLNPACDDVNTIVRLENLLARIVEKLALPTRWCVLSDIVKLTRSKELGAKIDLGFQSLVGTSKGLKGMVGIDVNEILELARGFAGLYFETGWGSAVTNGADEGIDMGTLESMAYGLARYLQQNTGKWTVVNAVEFFIGPEVARTEKQLRRVCAEDAFMAKLHGLTFGIDICATFHQKIPPERLRILTEELADFLAPAFTMAVPGNVDLMLHYLSTSPREHAKICATNRDTCHTSLLMKERLKALGTLTACGLPHATRDMVPHLYAEYQKGAGDLRKPAELVAEAWKIISILQGRDFDIGYGCPHKYVTPTVMQKRLDDIYHHSQTALSAKLDPAVLREVSPKRFETASSSFNREDYINHPETGNQLRYGEEALMRWCFSGNNSDIHFVLSDGLNANALNENLRYVLPGVRRGLLEAGFCVSEADIVVVNGRERIGYEIGRILQPSIVVHFIGERSGRKNMLSAYVTYGFDKQGLSRFHRDMNHSFTTAVCGIHRDGKSPEDAVKEIVLIARLMRERRCSGVELYAEKAIIL